MIFEHLDRFSRALARDRALIGLDFGTRTIGVAISDERKVIASALETIRRKTARQDLERLRVILNSRNAAGIILGLPINMNGTEGPRCQSTRAFGERLASQLDLPVTFWDERLSTVEAERVMLEAGASRRRRSAKINHVAAAIILQGALDRMNQVGTNQ